MNTPKMTKFDYITTTMMMIACAYFGIHAILFVHRTF